MIGNQGWRPTSLEDALGPAASRYFGAGYKQVAHELNGARCEADLFEGVGMVRYPAMWSTGADGEPRPPHLSTIDAVILPLRAICSGWGSSRAEYTSRARLRAGGRPYVRLDHVPVRVQQVTAHEAALDTRGFVASVGNMKAELCLSVSESVQSTAREFTQVSPTVYSDLYRELKTATALTDFEPASGELKASHTFATGDLPAVKKSGLESGFWPAVTVVDYLVTFGQIVQVLIANKYGAERTHGQLWMRSVDIQLTAPPEKLPALITSRTRPTHEHRIDRGDRRLWQFTTESLTSNGVKVIAQLAYVEEQ